MLLLQRFVITLFGAAMMVALHGIVVAIFVSHGWKPMSASDWGTWVGAIGTVGTLIGAIYIAHSESRSRNQDARVAAIIHAANFQHRLQAMRLRVEKTSKQLSGAPAERITESAIKFAISELGQLAKTFNSDEIISLIPLGQKAALKLAGVQSALGNASGVLSGIPAQHYRFAHNSLSISVEEARSAKEIINRQNDRLWEVMTTVYEAVTSAE
ncbi:hypothetical protein [Burkholderia sp. LMU1-1-1.1]|uniref:hypothetical protein n=1 Tax=Burkholderia sp. LMU1-1-1.1 TaxID=3135266 RepID=UPI00342DA453